MSEVNARYCPIDSVSGSLYLGVNAGKRLREDVENATKSIKVVSPYISDGLLSLLIQKHNKGVKVSCVTQEIKVPEQQPQLDTKRKRNRGYYTYAPRIQPHKIWGYSYIQKRNYSEKQFNSGVAKFILQHKTPIEAGIALKRQRDKQVIVWWILCAICLFLQMGMLYFYFRNPIPPQTIEKLFNRNHEAYSLIMLLSGFALALFCGVLAANAKYAAKYTAVTKYSYSALFPFRLAKEKKGAPIIHVKSVVIDDAVAYLGSLNFTYFGLHENTEMCFTVKEKEAVSVLSQWHEKLFESCESISIEEIAANCYEENPFDLSQN